MSYFLPSLAAWFLNRVYKATIDKQTFALFYFATLIVKNYQIQSNTYKATIDK